MTRVGLPSRTLGALLAGPPDAFGFDPCTAVLQGRPLMAHALVALAEHADQVVTPGRRIGGQSLPGVDERHAGRRLGMLAVALSHAVEHDFDRVLTIPCSVPFLPHNLASLLAGDGPAVLTDCVEVGIWPVWLAEELDWLLDRHPHLDFDEYCHHVGAARVAGTLRVTQITTRNALDTVADALHADHRQ